MNGSQNTDDVKKRLREMPRINAGGDFEIRLRRRLALPPRFEGILDRIPAFVYSSAAVALSCILIVFLMTTSGTPPQQNIKQAVSSQATPSEQVQTVPSPGQPPAARRQVEIAQPRLNEARKTDIVPRQMSSAPNPVPKAVVVPTEAPVTDASRTTAPEIDQQKTTTGTLELRVPDSLRSTGQKSRIQAPKVRDIYGVGTLGKSVSSPLTDSLKVDSLKRLRKQLLKPKAIERTPDR